MNVEIFCICDSAATRPDGRFYVDGIYGKINPTGFPSALARPLVIAFRLQFDGSECGKRMLQVLVTTAKGLLAGPSVTLQLNAVPDAGHSSAWISGSISIPDLTFSESGELRFHLHIDGKKEATCILSVKQP